VPRSPPPTQPTDLGFALGRREASLAAATLTHAHAVALPMASGSSSSVIGAVFSIQIIPTKVCLENSKVTEIFLKSLKLMNFNSFFPLQILK
jgi:hypothetical protein